MPPRNPELTHSSSTEFDAIKASLDTISYFIDCIFFVHSIFSFHVIILHLSFVCVSSPHPRLRPQRKEKRGGGGGGVAAVTTSHTEIWATHGKKTIMTATRARIYNKRDGMKRNFTSCGKYISVSDNDILTDEYFAYVHALYMYVSICVYVCVRSTRISTTDWLFVLIDEYIHIVCWKCLCFKKIHKQTNKE